MKILGGKFKGRNIVVSRGIRPVLLKLRKSCFDILKGEIEGKIVLDLFSGSGSLGLEALSRGAAKSVFVDSHKECIKALKKNITALGISSQVEIYVRNSFEAIKDFFAEGKSFDIIFLDPPYYKGMLRKALQMLEEYDILTPRGYIVGFCYFKDDFLNESRSFSIITSKKHGQSLLLIYTKC